MRDTAEILFNVRNQIGWIMLNRPKAYNAFSGDMGVQMFKKLKEWAEDDRIVAVVVEGAGEKAFCAGGDMRHIYELGPSDAHSFAEHAYGEEYKMNLLISEYPKPIVMILDGYVMGSGCGISAAADYNIVTEKTKWAMPELNIGYFPDVGASYFLNRAPGFAGHYLALTASIITAGDVIKIQAGDYFMEHEKINDFKVLLEKIVWMPPYVDNQLRMIMKKFMETNHKMLSPALSYEKIDEHFSHDSVEGIISSLQAIQNEDEWARETVEKLSKMPPTSLKVTLKQLKRGEAMDIKACLQMDLDLSMSFMKYHDLYEGVRAVLIDKDRKPVWKPHKLADVSTETVDSYFQYDWRDRRHKLLE